MPKKYKTIRKPKNDTDVDCVIDLSYEQYAAPADPQHINITVGENHYDYSSADYMEQQGKFLIRTSKWLRQQVKQKKVK